MNGRKFDDETLMAYADDALEPEEARRVARAAGADPDVAARIQMFRETGALLGALGDSRPKEPISDDLSARINQTLAAARDSDAATVVSFRAPRQAWRPMALAASFALAVGAVGGILASLALRGDDPSGLRVALLDEPSIATALDRLISGDRGPAGDGEVEIIASFSTADGGFCREFEYDAPLGETVISVACRDGSTWQTRFAVVAASADGGYAPASSLETLDSYLSAIGAGAPMSPEEEAARLAQIDG